MDREELKEFLLNIENYDDDKIEHISTEYLCYMYKLIDEDDFIEIYKSMPKEQFKKILNFAGINTLTTKILKNMNDIDLIIEYIHGNKYSYDEILDDEGSKSIFEKKEFYDGIDYHNIMKMYNNMKNTSNKDLMLKNFLSNTSDISQVTKLYRDYRFYLDNVCREYINEYGDYILEKLDNISKEEIDYLKVRFTWLSSLRIDDECLKIYNSLSLSNFQKLLSVCDVSIPQELFDKIEDKEKVILPFTPYNFEILKNEDNALLILSNKRFYNDKFESYLVEEVFDILQNDELKQLFITNLIKYIPNKHIIFDIRNEEIFKFINENAYEYFDSLIEMFKNIDLENISNEEKNIIKKVFGDNYGGRDTKLHIDLFNRMPRDIFKKIQNSKESIYFSDKVIDGILDKEKLVFPYSKKIYMLLENKKYLELVIDKEEFVNSDTHMDDYKFNRILNNISSDDLKTKFIRNFIKFNRENFEDILESFYFKDIAPYIVQKIDDLIIDFIKEGVTETKLEKYFSLLSDEKKVEIYNSDWFKEKYDLENYGLNRTLTLMLPEDALLENNVLSKSELISVYFREQKFICLKLFLNMLDPNEGMTEYDYILGNAILKIPDEHLNMLGSDKEKLYSIINNTTDSNLITIFFEYYPNNDSNSIIKDYMFYKVKDILEKGNIKLEKLTKYILATKDDKILELISNHITKSDLLLLSMRHPFFYMKVISLLEENPNYFKDCVIEDINKFRFLSVKGFDNYLKIYNNLNKEQRKIFYIPEYVFSNEEIKNNFILDISNDANILSSLDLFAVIYKDSNLIKKIIDNINVDNLAYLMTKIPYNKNIEHLLKPFLKNRIMDFVEYINTNEEYRVSETSNIFNFLEDEDLIDLINKIDSLSFLLQLFNDCRYNDKLKQKENIIKSRLIKVIGIKDNISIYDTIFLFDSEKVAVEFYDNLSFDAFMELCFDSLLHSSKNNETSIIQVNYIRNKLKENINLIYSISFIEKIDNLLFRLPNDLIDIIKKDIDEKFELYKNRYPKLIEYIDINSYSNKANYVNAMMNNLITDENIDIVYKLLEGNKYLFNSMDFRLLKPDLLDMGGYFLYKTSRYPSVSIKVNKIYESDKNKYMLLVKLSNMMKKEKNVSIYDQKIEIIINYLLQNDIKISENLDDNTISQIESYILEQHFIKNSMFNNLNKENYINEKTNLLDNLINKTNDCNKLKDLLFMKHFGLNKKIIEDFIRGYADNWYSVNHLCDNNLPNIYIGLIYKIWYMGNIDELKEFSNNIGNYTISDYLNITGIMKSTYNKSIINDLKDKNIGTKKEIIIDGEKIEVEDITDSFGIIVHSTDAYGSMQLLNDDYYDSWNNNVKTKNHGICCSYITNSSYGTASVKEKGVMFGFDIEDENDIPIYAPYDLATYNEGYNITSIHKPFFARLNTIADYTRHTHNEFSLERRKFDNVSIRQPKYIVIFEDMTDEVKINSIKAYNDFKKKGVDIKIKYINRVKNCENEASKLKQMISEFESNYDMNLLRDIINKYESNICSCDYLGTGKKESLQLFDQNELFDSNGIRNLLNKVVDYIKNINDIPTRNKVINDFIKVIEGEQYKFKLIDDFNSNRKHTFKLYDEKLKEDIAYFNDLLNKERGKELV